MCATDVRSVHRSQNRALDLLELELWMVLGFEPGSSSRAPKCCQPLNLFSSLFINSFKLNLIREPIAETLEANSENLSLRYCVYKTVLALSQQSQVSPESGTRGWADSYL